jgi:tetratricopeptide (TPR) repeat protein
MDGLIRELRRRKVFSSLGLYVGICWLAIQGASIMLPAFEAPAWILRALIILAFAGFPLVAVVAWWFNVTAHGLEHDVGADQALVPSFGARRLDFVVIGVLGVALAFSLYFNLTQAPEVPEAVEPVSVLIADFDNATAEPVFGGVLEQLLTMGLEVAPYVSLLDRNQAAALANEVEPDTKGLPTSAARLVAVREGVGVLLEGAISPVGRGYTVRVAALDPVSGTQDFDISVAASDRDDVPGAVAELSRRIREALGDASLREADPANGSRVERGRSTVSSIEAAKAYADAIDLSFQGDQKAASERFRRAAELAPDWGVAYAHWAVSEYLDGQAAVSATLWEKAMSLADTMPESDRLFSLGLYFLIVRQDYENALESFEEYVEKYPGSAAGRNNLAVLLFNTLDFGRAASEGEKLVETFPKSRLYRTNLALYAMYAGDFDSAASEAQTVVRDDPGYAPAYLPLAISSLEDHDLDGAIEFYRRLGSAPRGFLGESVATIGLVDTRLYAGQFRQAHEILTEGIRPDGDQRTTASAIIRIALAETHRAEGNNPMAVAAARDALALSDQRAIRVSAAFVLAAAGELESAEVVADELGMSISSFDRTYGMTIKATIQRESGRPLEAIGTLRAAKDIVDLWRIHWELGRAYLDAGFFAEALGEFARCNERRGEAVAMFLDDVPTYRYLAELPYWTARAQTGLGAQNAAAAGYEAFLALRPEGGAFVEDARARLNDRTPQP